MLEDKIRILIVEARFYDDLADEMLKAAADVITAHGAEYDVITAATGDCIRLPTKSCQDINTSESECQLISYMRKIGRPNIRHK